MNKIKSIWTTISGSVSSIIPLFFAVCKSGACTAVCVSPIASLLGVSSASMVASPITQSLFPLLLAISAVSFTVSYYKLYVLPKYTSASANACGPDADCCDTIPTNKSKQYKISLYTFWIGLIASIIFFTYFEYQNYQSNTQMANTEIVGEGDACCASGESCEEESNEEEPCCAEGHDDED